MCAVMRGLTVQHSAVGRAPVPADHLNHMGVEPGSDPHYARGVFLDFSLRPFVYSLIAPGCRPGSHVAT